MIYVYCETKSSGARDLVEQLGGIRLRQFDGMDFWRRGKRVKLEKGDVVVCWGRPAPEFEGVMVLNGGTVPSNKLDDLRMFSDYGVPTVAYCTYNQGGYLPRKKFHIGGNDLLNPPTKPDFWVRRYGFTHEYRIHSFDGKSIRAGKKVPRTGYTVVATEEEYKDGLNAGKLVAHPWIKSYDAGWMIDYTDFTSPEQMRKVAHKAVDSLGLTFGAVDIGEIVQFGESIYLVLEVNRAPGIEGNTITTYVKAIQRWIELEPVRQKKLEEDRKKLLETYVQVSEHPLRAQLERQEQNRRQGVGRIPPLSVRAAELTRENLSGMDLSSFRRLAVDMWVDPMETLTSNEDDPIEEDYEDDPIDDDYDDPIDDDYIDPLV